MCGAVHTGTEAAEGRAVALIKQAMRAYRIGSGCARRSTACAAVPCTALQTWKPRGSGAPLGGPIRGSAVA